MVTAKIYHINLGRTKIDLYERNFSEEGWAKLVDFLSEATVVENTNAYGDKRIGVVTDRTNFGPIVKFLPDISAVLHTNDPLKNVRGSLCVINTKEIGKFMDLLSDEFKLDFTIQKIERQ